jgi:hypothetical protein
VGGKEPNLKNYNDLTYKYQNFTSKYFIKFRQRVYRYSDRIQNVSFSDLARNRLNLRALEVFSSKSDGTMRSCE